MRSVKPQAKRAYTWFLTRDARRKALETNLPWASWFRWVISQMLWLSAPAAAILGLGKLAFLMAAAFPVIVWFIWTGK